MPDASPSPAPTRRRETRRSSRWTCAAFDSVRRRRLRRRRWRRTPRSNLFTWTATISARTNARRCFARWTPRASLGKVESLQRLDGPGSSLKSVSLVGARTQDAASAARALGERRFLAEGGGKKPKKGKKGGAKGKKGGAKKGARRVREAVPVLQSELRRLRREPSALSRPPGRREGTSSTSSIRRREASLALSLRRTTDT